MLRGFSTINVAKISRNWEIQARFLASSHLQTMSCVDYREREFSRRGAAAVSMSRQATHLRFPGEPDMISVVVVKNDRNHERCLNALAAEEDGCPPARLFRIVGRCSAGGA